MSDRIKGMKAGLLKLVVESKSLAEALDDKGEAPSPEKQAELAQAIAQIKALREQLQGLELLDQVESELTVSEARKVRDNEPGNAIVQRSRWGTVKNFRRDLKSQADEAAYGFGMWFASCFGSVEAPFTVKAREWCLQNGLKLLTEHGTELKTMKETVNTTGGFIVPNEFDSDLIDLREQYGVFRRNARIVPMLRDTKSIGRRTTGLTAYFVGEASAPTESEKAWDLVTLTARKLMTLTRVSSELNEDIIIQLGDDLAGEIGYAFANKEDECGFNGDGTSTYGGIDGLRDRLKTVYTAAGGVGLIVGAAATYASLTLANFNSVVGALPEFADTGRAKWYVSRFFWATVMQRLALAAGGVTAEEVEGKRMRTFIGYPVEVAQVMPKTTASAQVCALFGDLRLSSRFGDRRQTVISMSEHRYFDTDEIGVKGSERFDIVNHDVGDTSNPGPVVGLITA